MQKARKLRLPSFLTTLLMLANSSPLIATEKHTIARAAQIVIVGTFTPNITFLWFDGWHLSGKVTVDEVIYGGHVPREIAVRFPCKWNSYCQIWPPPQYPEGLLIKGLWFLQQVETDTWESPLGANDAGFRNISERAYWENYIRRYKP